MAQCRVQPTKPMVENTRQMMVTRQMVLHTRTLQSTTPLAGSTPQEITPQGAATPQRAITPHQVSTPRAEHTQMVTAAQLITAVGSMVQLRIMTPTRHFSIYGVSREPVLGLIETCCCMPSQIALSCFSISSIMCLYSRKDVLGVLSDALCTGLTRLRVPQLKFRSFCRVLQLKPVQAPPLVWW